MLIESSSIIVRAYSVICSRSMYVYVLCIDLEVWCSINAAGEKDVFTCLWFILNFLNLFNKPIKRKAYIATVWRYRWYNIYPKDNLLIYSIGLCLVAFEILVSFFFLLCNRETKLDVSTYYEHAYDREREFREWNIVYLSSEAHYIGMFGY